MTPYSLDQRDAAQYRDDADADDRMFWRQRNRRKHAHWQSAAEEQAERFRLEVQRPGPSRKSLFGRRILPIVR